MRCRSVGCVIVFFFQAEDGIRDVAVTGVQTCALPISIVDVAATAPAGIAVGLATVVAGIGVPTLWQSGRLKGASGALEQLACAVAEIGRASGRGRGEILGVAVSFKKKNMIPLLTRRPS